MNHYSKNVKKLCTVFLYLKPNWKTPLQRLSLYTAFTNCFREYSGTAGKPPLSQLGTSSQIHPPAPLPPSQKAVPTEQEAGGCPQTVWTF